MVPSHYYNILYSNNNLTVRPCGVLLHVIWCGRHGLLLGSILIKKHQLINGGIKNLSHSNPRRHTTLEVRASPARRIIERTWLLTLSSNEPGATQPLVSEKFKPYEPVVVESDWQG